MVKKWMFPIVFFFLTMVICLQQTIPSLKSHFQPKTNPSARIRSQKKNDPLLKLLKQFQKKGPCDRDVLLFSSAMISLQRERQNSLERACEKEEVKAPTYERYAGSHPITPTIYYSSNYKVMFCEVPKVGCTEFKLALLDMENIVPENYEARREVIHEVAWGAKTLLQKAKNITKVEEMFETYYKIMIVRDPFERLVSAYRDKLAPNKARNPYYTPISESMRRQFHPNCEKGERANFEDFVDFLLDENKRGRKLDLHWNLYTRGCEPCTFKYDYIAKLETIEKDAIILREVLGLNRDTSRSTPVKFFVGADDNVTLSSTSPELVKIAFASVPLEKKLALYDMYKTDFETFGYPYPEVLLEPSD